MLALFGCFAGPKGTFMTWSRCLQGQGLGCGPPLGVAFFPANPSRGAFGVPPLETDPHTQPIWQITLDTKPFPMCTGLQALNKTPDSEPPFSSCACWGAHTFPAGLL